METNELPEEFKRAIEIAVNARSFDSDMEKAEYINGAYFAGTLAIQSKEEELETWKKENESLMLFRTEAFIRVTELQEQIDSLTSDNRRLVTGILKVRDQIALGDLSEAYHQLYLIADPEVKSTEPWKNFESLSQSTNKPNE